MSLEKFVNLFRNESTKGSREHPPTSLLILVHKANKTAGRRKGFLKSVGALLHASWILVSDKDLEALMIF